MNAPTSELLQDLIERTEKHLATVKAWLDLPLATLQAKPSAAGWSVLECIEHLNLYGRFYLPEMAGKMQKTSYKKPQPTFKSSWLGEYFANTMLPQEPLNSMPTFKDKNPNGSTLDKQVLTEFVQQQEQTLQLLQQAATVNLTKTKTGITITRLIRLRLGDTFRVVIYHNYRHIVQAQKLL